jgi:CDP-6-deoxy-D-xylo-4-hexulose-3-dehydrase
VPVFVDVDLRTYNLDPAAVEAAATPRTRAVMFAHALGNPADMDALTSICSARKWELIEDCCDALGSTYRGRQVGTFGSVATLSFFPAHHITTGEGGAVLTDDPELKRLVDSYRDWGRDCHCQPGEDNSCGRRFETSFPGLPNGYDHKFVYSRVGWNLKATDLQAAIGVAQLEKLGLFIKARRENWDYLREGLADLNDKFVLPDPTPYSDPSWFGFALSCWSNERDRIVKFLESRKIATRPMFGGNLTRQPAYRNKFGIVGDWLHNSGVVMEDVFWLGVYPGLTRPMLDYVIESVHEAVL